jgi:hypothetical protein
MTGGDQQAGKSAALGKPFREAPGGSDMLSAAPWASEPVPGLGKEGLLMKTFSVIAGCVGVLLWMTTPALAEPVDLTWDLQDGQDDNNRPETDELGDQPPFPDPEWIISSWVETTYRPCPVNPDYPDIPNIEVAITNMTGQAWWNLQYVADVDTSIQNYDKWRINDSYAFLIDNRNLNQPLISESLNPNLVFEPGETWVFVIQDFASSWGGPPTPFDSIGVGSQSLLGPPSTGSIIGYVPEPATLALIAIGSLVPLWRRR